MNQKDVVAEDNPCFEFSEDDKNSFIDFVTMELVSTASISDCGHTFDSNSINQWITSNQNCPNCKAQLHTHNLHNDVAFNLLLQEFKNQDTFTTSLFFLKENIRKIFVDPITQDFITEPVFTTCCGNLYNKSSFDQLSKTGKCCENSNKKAIPHFSLKYIFETIRKKEDLAEKIIQLNKLKQDFCAYLLQNNLNEVKMLLEKAPFLAKIPLDNQDDALHIAIKKVYVDIIALLLQYPVEINKKDSNGYPPLCLAVKIANAQITSLLLQSNEINLDEKSDKEQKTAEQLAEELENIDISLMFTQAEVLMKKTFAHMRTNKIAMAEEILLEIYHNFEVEKFRTTLDAIYKSFPTQFPTISEFLIRKLAVSLIQKNQDNILMILISHAPHTVNETFNGCTMLHHATYAQNVNLMEFLLRSGAKVNKAFEEHSKGATAIMIACQKQSIPAIDCLLDRRADIHAVTESDNTAIFSIISANNVALLKYLLQVHYVNFNDYRTKISPLQKAVIIKNKDMVQFFLSLRTTDVNRQSSTGKTALHYAVMQEAKDIVELLLKCTSIDVDVLDDENKTAEAIALEKGFTEIYALFTAPSVMYTRVNKYLNRQDYDRGLSHLLKIYNKYQGSTLLLYLSLVEQKFSNFYNEICVDILVKKCDAIIINKELDLLLKLIVSTKQNLTEVIEPLMAQQKFTALALVLVIVEDIQNKELFEKLVSEKNTLCQALLKYLNIVKEQNEQTAEDFLNNTIYCRNALGKIVAKTPFFDFGSTEKLRKSLIEYGTKNFTRHAHLVEVKA